MSEGDIGRVSKDGRRRSRALLEALSDVPENQRTWVCLNLARQAFAAGMLSPVQRLLPGRGDQRRH